MPAQPHLLILGASGGVANAFLHHLATYRTLFGKVVLLDTHAGVLKNPFVDHDALDYTFIREAIDLPRQEKRYLALLKKHRIDIVLDLTDADSTDILEATDKAGVTYLNTSMNNYKKTVKELVTDIVERRALFRNAPHILCAGMNPGIVNLWVRHGIERFGMPTEIVHFEYDTSAAIKKWYPSITWSIHEFLVESVNDPSGVVVGRGAVKDLLPNALEHRENMKPILQPIMRLAHYPSGMTVLHEENISIGYKYNVPSKFVYAIDPKTLKTLVHLYRRHKHIPAGAFRQADNTHEILNGADNIGVILDYPDKKVYYFNTVPNIAIMATNATYTQVVIGIFGALFTLLFDRLKPGVYFTEDLYNTHFKHFIFDNMRVQQMVFRKLPHRRLKPLSYDPMVRIKHDKHVKHLFII
jgi:hypothetical protein